MKLGGSMLMKMSGALAVISLIAIVSVGINANAVEPATVSAVDLKKYIGKWHEVASIPQFFQRQCVSNTVAEYSLTEDGLLKIVNSCDKDSGARSIAEGRAKVVDTATNSKLQVTFVKIIGWIFSFGGSYWILDLAPDYSYAVVGDPSLKYLWILSRQPTFSRENFVAIEKNLRSIGYDTCAILTSVQNGGISARQPLCEYTK